MVHTLKSLHRKETNSLSSKSSTFPNQLGAITSS